MAVDGTYITDELDSLQVHHQHLGQVEPLHSFDGPACLEPIGRLLTMPTLSR